MARIRSIKPEFFRHAELYDLEANSGGLPIRVAFAGLWTAADREGRFKWSPRQLKLDCLPYDDTDFGLILDTLERGGFIRRYTVDGEVYGCIPSWAAHQVINMREAKSKIPEPPPCSARTETHVQAHDEDCGEGKGKEGKGREGDSAPRSASPPDRGTRIPDGWVPASEAEISPEMFAREFPKFVDHFKAKTGKDATKRDWQAAWRNWCRRSVEFKPAPIRAAATAGASDKTGAVVPTRDKTEADWKRILDGMTPNKKFWVSDWGRRPDEDGPWLIPTHLVIAWRERFGIGQKGEAA